jgi:hypothetical protein
VEGNYKITVTDAKGCSSTKTVFLDNMDRTVEAILLVASEASMSDTIVAIEVSWPQPENMDWTGLNNFNVITDMGYYKELVPKATGTYKIGLTAYINGCPDKMEKSITITEAKDVAEKSLKEPDLIKNIKLYPNPNTGNFKMEVELSREADIRADLISYTGYKALPTVFSEGGKYYEIDYNHTNLAPGVYFVFVIAEDQVRRVRFVVE